MTFITLIPLSSCCKRESICLFVCIFKVDGGQVCHCTPTTTPESRKPLKKRCRCCFNGDRLFIEEMPLTLRNVCVCMCAVCAAHACVSLKSQGLRLSVMVALSWKAAPRQKKKNLHSRHFSHSWLRPRVLGREITPAFSHCKVSLLDTHKHTHGYILCFLWVVLWFGRSGLEWMNSA